MSAMTTPPRHDATKLYNLYQQDQLLVHMFPPALGVNPPEYIMDEHRMLRATLLFCGGGVRHAGRDDPLGNSIARFEDNAQDTLFGTLHALSLVEGTHAQLEARKGEREGRPFCFFGNRCDIDDIAQACGGAPCDDYLQCVWQETEPVQLQRTFSTNFRELCEAHPQENTGAGDWNEMRAVLSLDNMVGLLFVDDGRHDPRAAVPAAERLSESFDHAFEMVVFKTYERGGMSGHLLVVPPAADAAAAAAAQGAAAAAAGVGSALPAAAGQRAESSGDDGVGAAGAHDGGKAPRLLTFKEHVQRIREELRTCMGPTVSCC